MKKFILIPVFAVLLSSLTAQAEDDSQSFTNGRFALVAAEVDVISNQSTQSNKQNVVFKIDRKTGRVWVLQLRVYDLNNPIVGSAYWMGVSEMKPRMNNNSN